MNDTKTCKRPGCPNEVIQGKHRPRVYCCTACKQRHWRETRPKGENGIRRQSSRPDPGPEFDARYLLAMLPRWMGGHCE